MDMKPNNFYVGLVDFFSILLPGALLAFLCLPIAHQESAKVFQPVLQGTEAWVAFTFAAYLLGQLISLVGATFMDWLYDQTYLNFKTRRPNRDLPFKKAQELAGANGDMAGVLKWARAYVRLRSSDASLECDRFEATSKFFRSLFVVLLAYAATFAFRLEWASLSVTIALLILAFWRYCNQRWKFTERCCIYFIELSMWPAG
jgi:hypothetical protein